MATDEKISHEEQERDVQTSPDPASISGRIDPSILIEPDLDFVREIDKKHGESYKKCMQCGTCSATCALASDTEPFPGQEMAWAIWGYKEPLMRDLNVWLCYNCNDCSTRCPRGARPGDVLSIVRQECVIKYSFPSFFGRWMSQPQFIPLLLAIPVILLTLAILVKDPLEQAFGLTREAGERIAYSYSNMFPHWLLNGFFAFFGFLVLLVMIVGVIRLWSALKKDPRGPEVIRPVKSISASIKNTIVEVFTHKTFTECTAAKTRYLSHICVFFGFIALTLVTIWVITNGLNPLFHTDFVYPFAFLSPWKILANIGGAVLLFGCLMMIYDRYKENGNTGPGTYFDWFLLVTLLMVVLSGFFTEILHYIRLEPHRHIIYFGHLVFVFALLIYMPYSKFAHLVYRTVALVFAEYTGRNIKTAPVAAENNQENNKSEINEIETGTPAVSESGSSSPGNEP